MPQTDPQPFSHNMMNRIFFAAALLTFASTANAQFFSLGLKGGLNSQLNQQNDIHIGSPNDADFNLGIKGRNFGTQFGGYMRFGKRIFVQPEVMFNSNKTTYVIGESSVGEVLKNEKYQYLDIPVLMGIKLGPVRLQAGPVGHYFLKSTSELTDISGYQARFKEMTWGWQGGLNIGTRRVSVDLRYEGNFSKQADHLNFFGTQYHFSDAPSRLIVGLNFAII